jgi:hypothetical protein
MDNEPRTVVGVRPASALAARPRLFAALEAAFPVEFRRSSPGTPPPSAVISIAEDPGAGVRPDVAGAGVPVFVVAGAAADDVPPEVVHMVGGSAIDARVRGIRLEDRLAHLPLERSDGDDVLAVARSGPVWTRRGTVDRVRAALPELGPDQVLYALLSRRPVAAVALVQFLRRVCEPAGWRPPPLRAAFVFDDPNLRWRSYGYIDYRRLAGHADEHGYHAAMAMIPLDAWRPHRATAALFAGRSDRLSLVFHGNDHTKDELLRPSEVSTALAMAAQSVRRIARFERRSGLRVDRVMMPPHGMCSEAAIRALGEVGFDALCTLHPRPWTEQPPSDPPLAGWQPAEFVRGCAVIARIPVCSSLESIALRAFLDHPLVIYGHHEDVSGGLEPLAEAAALVNGLGTVDWCSVGEIVRGNYSHRLHEGRLVVRPHARRLRVEPKMGAHTLCVEAPTGPAALRGWSIGSGRIRAFGEDVPVEGGVAVDVRLHGTRDVDPDHVAAPSWRPWPQLRRVATETRDRALPLRPALNR